jgi:D-alanyl-D-alanine carboxypeptidase
MHYKIINIMAVSLILTGFSCKGQPKLQGLAVVNHVEKSKPIVSPDAAQKWDLDYIMGKFDPAKHLDFMEIPAQYRDEEVRYLRKDVFEAYKAMYEAAKKDGINLKIISATRNFDNQKRIWENKWTGATILSDGVNAARDISDPIKRARKILQYSSMPGTSRHHWGTDIDLNNLNSKYFISGEGLKIYIWLVINAPAYGFCQPYSAIGGDRSTGYHEEQWHWSYVPIASQLTQTAKEQLNNNMITGFKGAETAEAIDMLNNYILGISTACQNR